MTWEPTINDIKIANSDSGKFLRGCADRDRVDSDQVDRDRGTVGQSDRWDGDERAQRWRLVPLAEGKSTYRIEHVATGMILAVDSDASGARVHLRCRHDQPHEKWRILPVGDGEERALINVRSGQAIDLWAGRIDNDAAFRQCTYWHGPRQRWTFEPARPRTDTRAVLTAARDEPIFLPLWLCYYRQYFAPEDIYVLDHQSTAEHLDDGSFIRIPVFHGEFGTGWHRDLVQRYQHDLIDRYDVVLCADVDEIIAPDPRHGDLGSYIGQFDQDYVTCQGYELLHQKDEEPALDLSRPILAQRSTWFPNRIYSKSLLARVPMLWHGGFHERSDRATNTDPDLYLIHLHRMDYELCWQRHRDRSRYPREQVDLDRGWVYQNQVIEPEAFFDWFYHDSGGGSGLHAEKIPEHWRAVV